MELRNDIVKSILEYLRDHSDYGECSVLYSDLPGEHSDKKIDFHMQHYKDMGFITFGPLAAGHGVIAGLTPRGLEYL